MTDQVPTRQGQLWEVHTAAGRALTVVIVDDDAMVARAPMIACVQVRNRDEIPEQVRLLAIPLNSGGVASISDLQLHRRNRFAVLLGEVLSTELDLIKIALTVRLGL